jgi:hypothetical protein
MRQRSEAAEVISTFFHYLTPERRKCSEILEMVNFYDLKAIVDLAGFESFKESVGEF